MKTVVFITGTNAVGKSTLAKLIMERYGGIGEQNKDLTYCVDNRYCLVGAYDGNRYGGVDRLRNAKGSSCTSRLAEVVETALNVADVVYCEGMYMNTFGLNLTNALFKGDNALVVSLYAPPQVIIERVKARSEGKFGDGRRNWPTIVKKQTQAMLAARKFQSIGVKTLQFDTSRTTPAEIFDAINATIEGFSKQPKNQ